MIVDSKNLYTKSALARILKVTPKTILDRAQSVNFKEYTEIPIKGGSNIHYKKGGNKTFNDDMKEYQEKGESVEFPKRK